MTSVQFIVISLVTHFNYVNSCYNGSLEIQQITSHSSATIYNITRHVLHSKNYWNHNNIYLRGK